MTAFRVFGIIPDAKYARWIDAMIICPGLFLGGSRCAGSCQCIPSFRKLDRGQERFVHAYTRTLVKMVRICKITTQRGILKLKNVVIVVVCSGSPRVVHVKTVFSS